MVPQPFATRGNWSRLEFSAVTDDLRYKTLTVAPEPTVEPALENVLLMGGKIDTHMLLRALPRDSAVRLWGESLHNFNWESRGGAHRAAPEDASEIKAQAEAKSHMYCFVSC
jgi:hypothetical protein